MSPPTFAGGEQKPLLLTEQCRQVHRKIATILLEQQSVFTIFVIGHVEFTMAENVQKLLNGCGSTTRNTSFCVVRLTRKNGLGKWVGYIHLDHQTNFCVQEWTVQYAVRELVYGAQIPCLGLPRCGRSQAGGNRGRTGWRERGRNSTSSFRFAWRLSRNRRDAASRA